MKTFNPIHAIYRCRKSVQTKQGKRDQRSYIDYKQLSTHANLNQRINFFGLKNLFEGEIRFSNKITS